MTLDQIQQALNKIDLILRPQILFLHPDDYKTVLQAIPDLEERVRIVDTKAIDKGHAVLMDRKWLEEPATLE